MAENNSSSEKSDLAVFIDNCVGDDVKNLRESIEKDLQRIQAIQEDIKTQIDVTNKDTGNPLKDGIYSTEEALEKCATFSNRRDDVMSNIDTSLEKSCTGSQFFLETKVTIDQLERYIQYMKYIAKIKESSDMIQQYILSDSMRDACEHFKQLVFYHGCCVDNKTKCNNLTSYLKKTIMFWYKILKDKLSRQLEDILKQINWPFLTTPGPNVISYLDSTEELITSSPSYTQPRNLQAKLDQVIGNLLNIHLPKHVRGKQDDEESTVILLPFQIMLRPLRKRFHYHFTGKKDTNSLYKPEWYLSQVLNWIENHSGFLESTVQPIFDNHKHQYVDCVVMFTQGLVQLVTCKLAIDIESIIYSDDMFSHVLDEVLLFDRDLRNLHQIPSSVLEEYSPLTVISQQACITKWVNIEKSWAIEKLDQMLDSEEAWRGKYSSASDFNEDDVDEQKIPQCAFSVVTMLLTLTDRYKNLPDWHQKIRFLQLQLNLLDDYRLRITQIIRSISYDHQNDMTCFIINAAYHFTLVLSEWGDNIFFLELKFNQDKIKKEESNLPDSFKTLLGESQRIDDSDNETVFEGMCKLYEMIYKDGIDNLLHQIMNEFKMKSYSYITEQWSTLPTVKEQVTQVVSRSACSFLGLLQEKLILLEEKLCLHLFSKTWRLLAEEIDNFFLHEVIMKNKFNEGGAFQFKFDMEKNLFPIFRPYTSRPENYFKRIKEASALLTGQIGNFMLFKQERERKTPVEKEKGPGAEEILADMGVFLIKPEDATVLLERRIEYLKMLEALGNSSG